MSEKKYVWEFTNKKKLTKSEFLRYFEKKIFKTIRQYEMLPEDKNITLKKSNDLNTNVLKSVLETKFSVTFSSSPNFSAENLSQVSEETLSNVVAGKFSGTPAKDEISRPLYFLSDEEISLYGKLSNISGDKRERDEKIQELFEKFKRTNKDLEVNIVKALEQLPN